MDHPLRAAIEMYEICLCCGTEYGLDVRQAEDVHVVRREWLQDGAPWFDEGEHDSERPNDWDVAAAKAQILSALGDINGDR